MAATLTLLLANIAVAGVRPEVAAAAPSPIGAHSMLQLNSPYSFMQTMFAEAAAMGVSAIRLDVAPTLVFTAPSQPPNFTGLDEVMALSRQYHLQVVGDLFTIPWWISACQTPADIAGMALCGTDDLGEYGSLISQIVAHADPVIRNWEIWNEPDSGSFFTGTPQQYAWMLRAAHDAIKQVDQQADVLLGGISGLSGMSWLGQVLATPGADSAQAFDIATIHERDNLDALAGDIAAFKKFLGGYGFTGPLWVTEHGYPSDPAFQYDPAYIAGQASQAAYLTASIPTLIDAGASEVFVTERDNLSGQFASEGVLGGDVSDPPVANPQVVEKPAYAAVQTVAGCYTNLGRDCLGPVPAPTPTTLAIPATRLGSSSVSSISVSDPGPGPLQLGTVALDGADPSLMTVQGDSCSSQILEPDQTCSVAVRFTPVAGGAVTATMQLPSDNGTLSVPATAVAPSVSSLTSPQLISAPAFTPTRGGNGVGHTQRLVLELFNPLSAPVHVARSTLSGADSHRFSIRANHCARTTVAPGSRCGLLVLFTPTQTGTAWAILTLRGDGTPLSIMLRATAFALPTVTLVGSTKNSPCFAPASYNRVRVMVDQPSALSWRVVRQDNLLAGACPGQPAVSRTLSAAERSSAHGRASTGVHAIVARGAPRYVARFGLPLGAGRAGLRPGVYRMSITPINAHGAGPSKTMVLTVVP